MIDPTTVTTVARFLRPRTWRRLRWLLIAYAAGLAIYTVLSKQEGEIFGGLIVIALVLFGARLCGRVASKLETAESVVLGRPNRKGGAIVSKRLGTTLLMVTPTGLDVDAAAALVKRACEDHGLLYVESDFLPRLLHFLVVDSSSSVGIWLHPRGDSDCTLDVDTASTSRGFNAWVLEILIEALEVGGARLRAVTPNDKSFVRSVKERYEVDESSLARSIHQGERLLGSVRGDWETTENLRQRHVLGVSLSSLYHWHHQERPLPKSTAFEVTLLDGVSSVRADNFGEGVRLTIGWKDRATDTVLDVTNGKLAALLNGLREAGVSLLDATEGRSEQRLPGLN